MSEFNKYILTNASIVDLDRIKEYKKDSIFKYASKLSSNEIDEINNYVDEVVPKQINCYKNIILSNNIIGSILVSKLDEGVLIDEFISKKNIEIRE